MCLERRDGMGLLSFHACDSTSRKQAGSIELFYSAVYEQTPFCKMYLHARNALFSILLSTTLWTTHGETRQGPHTLDYNTVSGHRPAPPRAPHVFDIDVDVSHESQQARDMHKSDISIVDEGYSKRGCASPDATRATLLLTLYVNVSRPLPFATFLSRNKPGLGGRVRGPGQLSPMLQAPAPSSSSTLSSRVGFLIVDAH
ncbi:hypothetical protein IFR05_000685 [Cadophora sp. M221]|nr:hypothetical protein IFR05_000685 [Cadophora sp. M221]